ncbi:efflux RND transporter permease subunit [Patescibacteria group bacterium]|nr:efflux RND transporter permease subunit [Patescibacteria group bacterium]
MHSLWLFFLHKREFSILLILALIGLGTYAVTIIPKESFPEVIVPVGIVTTVYPGAGAADIEELVTNKLEDAIANLEDIENLTSTSRDDVSSISVEFTASADIDKSIQKLKDAVDSVKNELPADANDPIVSEVDFSNQPILIVAVSADVSGPAFTALGEAIKDELTAINGVSEVQISGTRERQIQVLVREESLTSFGISINDVTSALGQANLTVPVGTVATDGIEYAVRFEGKLNTIDDIKSVPIKSNNGQVIYIRDVADVTDGVSRESTISRVSVDGVPSEASMTLTIYKKAGGDVTDVTDPVLAKIDELKQDGGLLSDSQVLVVFDQGKQVRKDLSELIKAGLETVVLVVLVLLLTIGWRESLVAALSIPLSFVIAFIGLYASGNTINFISLFALILSVGILVDSGIVVTEAIHTRMRKSGNAMEAAEQSIREYAWPLIAGTMTTVAVFAPLFFLSGVTGEFIASIPFTIIFVLIASIFVALGLVPLIAIYLTKDGHSNKFEEIQEAYTEKAQLWYRTKLVNFLQSTRKQRILLWSLFIGLIVAFTLPATGLLKVIFFPPENVDEIYVEIETTQGTPVTETDLVVRQVEEILYEKDYIKSFTTTAGAGSAFTGSTNAGGKFANITISLDPEREESSIDLAIELRKEFADVKGGTVKITEQQNGPPTGAPVFIKLSGDSLADLLLVSDRAEALLNDIEGTRDVEASSKSNATEFVLTVDKGKASNLGVPPAAVGGTLRSAVFGVEATTISQDGEDIDVVVRLGVDKNTLDSSATPNVTLDTLRNLTVTSIRGESVPLSSITNETLASANAAINHEDKERQVTVGAFTEEGVVAGDVVAQFKERVSELEAPDGVEISYGGEAENVNQSFTEMFIALAVGLLLMLAILVLSFNSIRYSLYLLLVVPYSLIGVFAGLAATGLALSFTSLLGVIALAGVIINHNIILMDSMITHKGAKNENESLIDQVADASVSRFRPIMLTTITTVIGMIPLSTISDFWSPLAFAIMFGLTFAMILTLVLVPTLYYRNELAKLNPVKKQWFFIRWPKYIYHKIRRA